MDSDDPDHLDERIETLMQSLDRCRKIATAAKAAIAAGFAWLVLSGLTIVPPTPETLLTAAAAVLGGIVLLGSNGSTWAQMQDALATAQALRDEMIASASTFGDNERPTLH
jgi:hypothetical protein